MVSVKVVLVRKGLGCAGYPNTIFRMKGAVQETQTQYSGTQKLI